MPEHASSPSDRRSFLARLSAGAAAFAAALATGTTVRAQSSSSSWQPARHAKDDWLDELPGRHRLVFDATNAEGFGEALAFASNFIRANQMDYGVEASELAIVIIARHRATSLAYTDGMWEKYGKVLSARAQFTDPKSKQPPTSNLFNSADYGAALTNRGNTLPNLLKQRVQFAVCGFASRALSGAIAEATGQKADTVLAELGENLISSTQARLVVAGIVAVNRAQERGYTLVAT